MNYTELMKEIDNQIQRLNLSSEQVREYLTKHHDTSSLNFLRNEQLQDFLNYLRQQPSQHHITLPSGLFDQMERYLEAQAANADPEASRLLMELEDLEIDRITKQE
ncbi:hypothetical protein Ava_D0041 [Trichormus variabilis ATCC 29413]|uniref:Uncharacterized protein n=2 Tax=Anabaena variabilis TaxID=264691 RepID=Q3M2T0_TRIV2|nr:hypothetical protein [Trichormus variabilis]ABA24706.1 hypothetical protein Ava_D0041 [Trichormus variabilis ATCC 29413]MBC1217748.1 hypothetical protein [Trichormus variabilis ARAD]MBC1258961.1 hypothetical protein [Trichormus variabilis V5]MBC1302672.1 hypothetical protein [Trichormus variabilis N2B]MBC1324527.1 hypothetical protein [Trichormus variabilis 9RC]